MVKFDEHQLLIESIVKQRCTTEKKSKVRIVVSEGWCIGRD